MTTPETASPHLHILLRLAMPDEARAIRRLIQSAHINPTGLHWKRFLVAVTEDGILVGCGQVKPHADGSRELASIAVEPAWRRQGIATRLIQRLLAENPPPLYLTCRSRLEPFYQQFGFVSIPESIMPPYYQRISRLVNTLRTFRITDESLCVMIYNGK